MVGPWLPDPAQGCGRSPFFDGSVAVLVSVRGVAAAMSRAHRPVLTTMAEHGRRLTEVSEDRQGLEGGIFRAPSDVAVVLMFVKTQEPPHLATLLLTRSKRLINDKNDRPN